MKPLRRLAAILTLTAAALFGTAGIAAADSGWGTPPPAPDPVQTVEDVVNLVLGPLDSGWG